MIIGNPICLDGLRRNTLSFLVKKGINKVSMSILYEGNKHIRKQLGMERECFL